MDLGKLYALKKESPWNYTLEINQNHPQAQPQPYIQPHTAKLIIIHDPYDNKQSNAYYMLSYIL